MIASHAGTFIGDALSGLLLVGGLFGLAWVANRRAEVRARRRARAARRA